METKPEYDPCRPVFIINPEAHPGNLTDGISERLLQLHALAVGMISDDEEGEFERLSFEARANYVWALNRKIEEIRELFDAYTAKCIGGEHGTRN